MNPWIAKTVILAASVVMVVIRAPHGRRSRGVKVARSCKGPREVALLTLAWIGFLVPLFWVVSPVFSFAEYSLRPWPFGTGVLCLATGLWWFHRSHSDLGTYWSVSLELRENHRLITHGIYRHVRHPMYSALFLYSIGQALVVLRLTRESAMFVCEADDLLHAGSRNRTQAWFSKRRFVAREHDQSLLVP